MALLLSDKGQKGIFWDREYNFTKAHVYQVNITSMDLYTFNIIIVKYTCNLAKLPGNTNQSVLTVGKFNIHLLITQNKQNFNKIRV